MHEISIVFSYFYKCHHKQLDFELPLAGLEPEAGEADEEVEIEE